MRFRKFMLVAGVAAAAWQVSGLATAQEQSGVLEEVMVTAQKREANVQKVPIAITALSSGTIEKRQIDDVATLVQAVPGLQYSFSSSNPQITLRGINNYSNGPWVESAMNIYVDGVYVGNNQASGFAFNNLERVEVLKGPQGTLFGRNALAGVINVTTKDPSHDPSADFELGYGNFDTVNGNFYGTTGLSQNLAADLALYVKDQGEGWGTNLYDNGDLHLSSRKSARSKWLYTPSDATRVVFSADYDNNEPPYAGVSAINGVYSFVPIGPPHVGGFWDSYLPNIGGLEVTAYGADLTIEHDFEWAQFVSITAKDRSKVYQNAARPANPPFNPLNPGEGQVAGYSFNAPQWVRNSSVTQEFQLKSPSSSRISWIAGVYILDEDIDNYAVRAPVDAASRYTISEQQTKSYAGFGQVTAPLNTTTRLTLGARYTSERKSVDGNTYTVAGVVIPGQSVISNPEPSKKWEEPTWALILDHDFSDRIMGYGSVTRGFQSGTYNISSSVNSGPLDPQTLDAYEIGLKSSMLDQRLRINTAVFYYEMHDLLVSQNINTMRVMFNAAEATYKGVDLDITYLPLDNLMLTAGFGYVDPVYSDYKNATFYIPTANGDGNWTTTSGDATGNQVAYAEKFSAFLSGNYDIVTTVGDVTLNASVNYHEGTHFDSQELLVQPSYSVIDALAKWTSPDGSWDVKLWGKNLANKKYASALFANTPVMFLNSAPPRTYGVTFGYHWN